MSFTQPSIAGRCLAAAEIYRRLGGSVSPFGALKGLTEARVRALEKRLKITLPPDLRALFLAAESAHFEWSLPAEQLASSGRLIVVTGGRLHWDPGILLEADALRRAWVKADFSDRTNERHRLWQDALPLYYLGDGEFVAIDRGSPSGESVVYLHPHLDVAHGTEIAPTFGEFMDRYTQLGCPGPDRERLMPFITSGIGIDLEGGPAQRWLEFLGADLRHSQ